jgi:hypothetical protein
MADNREISEKGATMRSPAKKLTLLLFTLSLLATVFNTGCVARARVYDSYDHHYRAWAPESGFYVRWEHETHRSHMDYKKRGDDDKNAYWKWRRDHN